MSSVKTLVVEDDPVTRQYLIDSIEQSGLSVIGSAENYPDAAVLVEQRNFDIMLVDLHLGNADEIEGIELIRYCRKICSDLDAATQPKILVISVFGDEKSVLSAVEAGADGYLLKDLDPPALRDAISRLLTGEAPISAAIAGHLLRKLRSAQPAPAVQFDSEKNRPTLSPREVDILEGLAKGYSYKEVAEFMGVSYYTVSDYVKNIYRKLAVHSKSEAIYEAVKSGLIEMA